MCAQEEKERDDDAKKADVSKPVIYMPRRYRNIDWDAIPKSDDAIVNDRDAQKQVGLARLRATAAAASYTVSLGCPLVLRDWPWASGMAFLFAQHIYSRLFECQSPRVCVP